MINTKTYSKTNSKTKTKTKNNAGRFFEYSRSQALRETQCECLQETTVGSLARCLLPHGNTSLIQSYNQYGKRKADQQSQDVDVLLSPQYQGLYAWQGCLGGQLYKREDIFHRSIIDLGSPSTRSTSHCEQCPEEDLLSQCMRIISTGKEGILQGIIAEGRGYLPSLGSHWLA